MTAHDDAVALAVKNLRELADAADEPGAGLYLPNEAAIFRSIADRLERGKEGDE